MFVIFVIIVVIDICFFFWSCLCKFLIFLFRLINLIVLVCNIFKLLGNFVGLFFYEIFFVLLIIVLVKVEFIILFELILILWVFLILILFLKLFDILILFMIWIFVNFLKL